MGLIDKMKKWLTDTENQKILKERYQEYLKTKNEDEYIPKSLNLNDIDLSDASSINYSTKLHKYYADTTYKAMSTGGYRNTYTTAGAYSYIPPVYSNYRLSVAHTEQFIRDQGLGLISYKGGLISFDEIYDKIKEESLELKNKNDGSQVFVQYELDEHNSINLSSDIFLEGKEQAIDYLTCIGKKRDEINKILNEKDLNDEERTVAMTSVVSILQYEVDAYNALHKLKAQKEFTPYASSPYSPYIVSPISYPSYGTTFGQWFPSGPITSSGACTPKYKLNNP
jgi:hypothetical protein